jgi:hypothetical protein
MNSETEVETINKVKQYRYRPAVAQRVAGIYTYVS